MSTNPPSMPIQSGAIPGIKLHSTPCPRCGSKMMVRSCPCFIRKKGFKTCARCLNPKCGNIIGIRK